MTLSVFTFSVMPLLVMTLMVMSRFLGSRRVKQQQDEIVRHLDYLAAIRNYC
jgi:hypothetical protein